MPQVVKGTLETMENTSKECISERTQVVDVTVPQIMEELQERIPERMYERVVDAPVLMTVHQSGDRARRVPVDLLHRQGCRYTCGDAVKGPSDSDCFEDSGKPAGAVRRQSCGRACDQAEEIIPQKRIPECVVGQIDDVQILNEIVEVVKAVKNVSQERISEGIGEQLVDAPVPLSQPQILKEVVEVVKAVKNVHQEHISEKIGEQIRHRSRRSTK